MYKYLENLYSRSIKLIQNDDLSESDKTDWDDDDFYSNEEQKQEEPEKTEKLTLKLAQK